MLIDPYTDPHDLSPADFAQTLLRAGLGGAVIARTHRSDGLDPWIDALQDHDLFPLVGVALRFGQGKIVLIPEDWESPYFVKGEWGDPHTALTLEQLRAHCEAVRGALIVPHPYSRNLGAVLGDEAYALPCVAGVVTKIGEGSEASWDNLAAHFAQAKGAARLGSSNGLIERIGLAATVIPDDVQDERGLVETLRRGLTQPVHFEEITR